MGENRGPQGLLCPEQSHFARYMCGQGHKYPEDIDSCAPKTPPPPAFCLTQLPSQGPNGWPWVTPPRLLLLPARSDQSMLRGFNHLLKVLFPCGPLLQPSCHCHQATKDPCNALSCLCFLLIYPPLGWPEPSFPGSKTPGISHSAIRNSPHYQTAWGSSGLISHCPSSPIAHWATSHSPGLLVLSHLLLDRFSSSVSTRPYSPSRIAQMLPPA